MTAVDPTTTTITDTSGHKGGRMSLETASHIFDLSSIALAIGACVVFVATALIVWTGIVKEHHWDRLREQAQTQIATLGAEAAKARSEIATANAEAAKANESAATANLEAEKLKAQLAWRRITKDQGNAIVDRLSQAKIGVVEVEFPTSDPEAAQFASDIMRLLDESKIKVKGIATLGASPAIGLDISKRPNGVTPGADWIALADAFKQAGLTFGLAEPAKNLKIIVGHKMPLR